MTVNQNRKEFREQCLERDNHQCVIPWCTRSADDVHHIIERSEWNNGGYIINNGASVCNPHHRYAENNQIPPQAFWQWINVDEKPTPNGLDINIDKWGKSFETPPWEDIRDRIKYQSTRHLLPLYWYDDETKAKTRVEHDDTGVQSVEDFVGVPLVITHKMDGSNCMLVNDTTNPVRARNGKKPEDTMRPLYRDGGLYWEKEVSRKLPDNLQVFGEWLYAKHSIHYGCDCDDPCEDVGPNLTELVDYEDESAYFQIFGVYNNRENIWLSWPETEKVADELGFPTTPVIYMEDNNDEATFKTKHEARRKLISYAREVVDNGGEGIVVRSKFPFHYDQFERRIGKYVRENHVNTDEHWKHTETIENNL